MVRFSESKVEYATHQLSLYHGTCGNCIYCFNDIYRRRNWKWATGELRLNLKAFPLATTASKDRVECLVVSFTSDPLPMPANWPQEEALARLNSILMVLEARKIPVKVLTKNANIVELVNGGDPFKHVQIGMSLTSNPYADRQIVDKFEPGASPMHERYNALRFLATKGYRTWASGEPPLPGTNLNGWITEVIAQGVEEFWIGRGNYNIELTRAFHWPDYYYTLVEQKAELPAVDARKIHFKTDLLSSKA